MTAPGRTPVRIPIIRNANRLRSAGTGAVPASRSHHLYSVREAEVGGPSNTALTTPSNNVIALIPWIAIRVSEIAIQNGGEHGDLLAAGAVAVSGRQGTAAAGVRGLSRSR